MLTFACMMHWYESMMFTIPTGAVGLWGWLGSRRAGERDEPEGEQKQLPGTNQ